MKDIKSLFEAAKRSGSDNDILSYTEAVNQSCKTPTDYISNLEYIISSSIGLDTFHGFIKENGLSIPLHEEATSIIEKCVESFEKHGMKDETYEKVFESLNAFREKYIRCFAMFEYYAGDEIHDYTRTYYSFTENGKQNRFLLSGMEKKFGEAAIADSLITADSIHAVNDVLKYVESMKNPLLSEWVYECAKNMECDPAILESVRIQTLSNVIDQMRERHTRQYNESVVSGKQGNYDYTESELLSLENYITYREYCLGWADEFKLDPIKECNEIGTLYEEYDGIFTESDEFVNAPVEEGYTVDNQYALQLSKISSMIQQLEKMKTDFNMQLNGFIPKDYSTSGLTYRIKQIDAELERLHPQEKELIFKCREEDLKNGKDRNYSLKQIGYSCEDVADNVLGMMPESRMSTMDKKTSRPAPYISNNHDMATFGEEDPEEDPSEEDYKRPSKKSAPIEQPSQEPANMEPEVEPTIPSTAAEPVKSANPTKADNEDLIHGSVNNYYYTYNNSLNRTHDDHSVHNDDHSVNKSINSYNKNDDDEKKFRGLESVFGDIKKRKETNDVLKDIIKDEIKKAKHVNIDDLPDYDDDEKKESVDPWDLSRITEAVGDADDNKPESDHPVKDILTDIDRSTAKVQQKAKKAVQDTVNVGKAVAKPIKRTKGWISNLIANWRDASETNIKEKMADPYGRKSLLDGVKKAITRGALLKAGILLNPVFLFLAITRRATRSSKEFRIRNEMIGELKNEMAIVDMKIDNASNPADKAKLMRFKNELNKKLLRVGGGKKWAKII